MSPRGGPLAGTATSEPVILLTCSHAGAEDLSGLLSTFPSLACTSRTGLLPLCDAVAATWQRVEDRGRLSALAAASIRALATSMIGVRTADAGAQRWCETTISRPGPAETFLKIFPGAQFVCFYRRCDDVISEAIEANPYGFSGTEFWPYSSAGPGNSVAMVGAYWADCVQALLEFERSQSRSCLAVRREDLIADTDGQMKAVCSFLGLPPFPGAAPRRADQAPPPAPGGARPYRFPADRLPPGLRATVNDLHARLGYPPL